MLTATINLLFYSLFAYSAYFYQSEDSLFPSGYNDVKTLSQNIIQEKTIEEFAILYQGQNYWVKQDKLIHERDLISHIQVLADTYAHSGASFDSKKSSIRKGKYRICKNKHNWLMLCSGRWIYQQETVKVLKQKNDLRAYTLEETLLYSDPKLNKVKTTILAFEKIRLIQVKNDIAKIKWQDQIYFLPLKYLLSSISFPKRSVYLKSSWSEALTNSSIKKIPGARFYKRNANRKSTWLQSKVPGHGLVWWKPTLNTHKSNKLLSSKDLSKQGIFDLAKATGQKISLVSSNGVYISYDDSNWQKIDYFKEQNYPLHISKNGFIYVGQYMSKNNGKTFQKHIPWQKLFRKFRQLRNKKISIYDISSDKEEVFISLRVENKLITLAKNSSGKWRKDLSPIDKNLVLYGF